MDSDIKSFLHTLEINGASQDDWPAWVAELACMYITEANVAEMLKILASSNGNANLTFWAKINAAPTSEAGWEKLRFVGGEMTEDDAEKQKREWRHIVAIVRQFGQAKDVSKTEASPKI